MREAARAAVAAREGGIRRLMEAPEAQIAAFSVLLHLPWEMGQVRFYRCAECRSSTEITRFCVLASVADAAIMLGALCAVNGLSDHSRWAGR